jgi:hypothetical protein
MFGKFLLIKMSEIKNEKQQHYFRIFDIEHQINTLYIEGEAFLLSGDKRYLWLTDKNQVYDIVDNLSTFFLWPGDLINAPFFDCLDIFNINEDRTIMVTGGILNLAFSGISIMIEGQYGSTKDFTVEKCSILNNAKMP